MFGKGRVKELPLTGKARQQNQAKGVGNHLLGDGKKEKSQKRNRERNYKQQAEKSTNYRLHKSS